MVVSLGEDFYGNITSDGVWFGVCYIADNLVIFEEKDIQSACIQNTKMADHLN